MSQADIITEIKSEDLKDSVIDFTAGCLGGVALVYVGQPLDTIKVKMQTYPTLYTNMVTCFKETLISDGVVRGLYAGTTPALVTNVTENSVLFLCYGICQKFIQRLTNVEDVKDLSTLGNASAGCLASFFSSLAICPTELVKCKLQAMHEEIKRLEALGKKVSPTTPSKLTAKIFREEGIKGLFRGLIPTLVREMPGYFFFFGGYEGTREFLRSPEQTKDDIGLLKTMIAGSVGGLVFWTLFYPVDVVKSRIQVMNQNTGLMLALMQIAKTESVLALYSGLTPTLVRTIPATAVLFATYEYSKKFLHNLF
ncbi:mitochondrial ornithine transporter 1 [Agrilus planipennis]|uniref:Mitochondrial ornithine transporter 1 n=1 Tax=Agrilus planipennis TaxID=224129 RepID=A0A1W4X4Z2_AGRPL|nr:mitochondrial ornithine transporter 1 [Agrilus planipennis]